jgi:hypothetical protein
MPLDLLEPGEGECVQVVDRDAEVVHDLLRGLVEAGDVLRPAGRIGLLCGDGRGRRPDEPGARRLQLLHERAKVLLVVLERHLVPALNPFEVVEAPVEMNDVPLAFDPPVDVRDPGRRGAAVFGDAVDVGLPLEKLSDGERVADRDRIADQEDAGELRVVGDRREGGVFRVLGPGGRGQDQGRQDEPHSVLPVSYTVPRGVYALWKSGGRISTAYPCSRVHWYAGGCIKMGLGGFRTDI